MILRSSLLYLTTLLTFSSTFQVSMASTIEDDYLSRIDKELGAKLSPKASIDHYYSVTSRWTTYYAPQPGTVVNVAEENDVVETVKYCIENNLDFLAQSGGHGWAKTFTIDKKDVIINMRGLNKISISDAKDTITFEGGALVGEVADTAYENQVETAIPSCSCVGMAGASLGGGFNRLMGKYGFVSDNLLSVDLVTAEGELITVTPTSSPDLWWALGGAGANFGVVTSITMKAYPPINNGIGWFGTLIFSSDQLEDLFQTLADFNYTEEMFSYLVIGQRPPDYTPSLMLMCFYAGSEVDAKAAFKPLYDIGPRASPSQEVPFNQLHHMFDAPACSKGFRRVPYSACLKKLDPATFRKIWNDYVSVLAQYPELNQTFFLVESFSPEKVRNFSDSSSAFPHRSMNFLVLFNPTYEDPKLDPIIEELGQKFRQLWIESSGFDEFRTYVNYAHGDEDPEAIYGENLPRLKKIKEIWDPYGRFSQFLPIPTGSRINEESSFENISTYDL